MSEESAIYRCLPLQSRGKGRGGGFRQARGGEAAPAGTSAAREHAEVMLRPGGPVHEQISIISALDFCCPTAGQERKPGGGGGGCNISVCVLHRFAPRERPATAGPVNEDLWRRKLPGERVISRRDAALIASTARYWHLETVGLLSRRFAPCQPTAALCTREEGAGANPGPRAGICVPQSQAQGHLGLTPRCFAASTAPACPCRCVRKPECLQPGSPGLLL